jgi:hypothetical protein
LIIVFLSAMAMAAPCDQAPLLSVRTQAAWDQYNDAEVAAAKAVLVEAYQELSCPQAVVTSSQLLDFYRLDGLVSISQSDQKGAIYATLRAAAVDHVSGAPPEAYGPYLAELYETWASRLAVAPIEVSVDGGGAVYIDGRPVVYGAPLSVAAGEHLVQIEAGGVFRNSVLDLAADHVVATGVPLPEGALAPATVVPAPAPVVPQPAPVAAPAPIVMLDEEPQEGPRRRRPLWTFAGAAIAGGGAAFALGSGSISERNFLDDPYRGFGAARDTAVYKDAQAVRLAYGLGYGLAAVSGGLLTVGVVGFSASATPQGIHLGARF